MHQDRLSGVGIILLQLYLGFLTFQVQCSVSVQQRGLGVESTYGKVTALAAKLAKVLVSRTEYQAMGPYDPSIVQLDGQVRVFRVVVEISPDLR